VTRQSSFVQPINKRRGGKQSRFQGLKRNIHRTVEGHRVQRKLFYTQFLAVREFSAAQTEYVLETAYIFVLWYLALYYKNSRGNRFHGRRNETQEFCTEKQQCMPTSIMGIQRNIYLLLQWQFIIMKKLPPLLSLFAINLNSGVYLTYCRSLQKLQIFQVHILQLILKCTHIYTYT